MLPSHLCHSSTDLKLVVSSLEFVGSPGKLQNNDFSLTKRWFLSLQRFQPVSLEEVGGGGL